MNEAIPDRVNDVYNIFKDFFGEEYVDLQNDNPFSIYVRFPEVTIENEFGGQAKIEELYAKIHITNEGAMGRDRFRLNRSKYSYTHYTYHYVHSHASYMSNRHEFRSCCTGTGPIGATCNILCSGYNESRWQMFCLELKKYVETESISGGPYTRLASLGGGNDNYIYTELKYPFTYNLSAVFEEDGYKTFKDYFFNEFLRNYIEEGNIQLTSGRNISVAMPMHVFTYNLSNSFITWYNNNCEGLKLPSVDDLISKGILMKVTLEDSVLKIKTHRNLNYSWSSVQRYIGTRLFTFKGKDVLLEIYRDTEEEDNEGNAIILNPSIVTYILAKIIIYCYNRTNENNE